MGLDQVVDYSAAWTFTDAFKHSRDWFTLSYNTATAQESWDGGGTPVVDAKGWPVELQSWTNASGQLIQQRLGTLMFREIGGNYPAGVYHAQWRGTGTVSFGFDASVIASGTNPDGTRWADLNVTPSASGILMKINAMPAMDADPTDAIPPAIDPIRDVHVWLPDYNGQSFKGQVWEPGASFSPFHPLFVERLSPFKTLRFMDWMKTNGSTNETWGSRRTWDEANQAGPDNKGVAVEYMVALANEIGADMWVNMPYKADDDYVRQFATYVRDNLNPALNVDVEWSNEIWNSAGGFKTFSWITEQLALPENAGKPRYQFAAEQIERDFDIWSDVFSTQPAGRLTRVLAGQAANPEGVTEVLLQNMNGKFDAVAVTGYFGLSSAQRAQFNASTTAERVAQAVMNNVPSAIRGLETVRALGQQYGGGRPIKLYAYEAGQHADGQGIADLPYLNALYAAQTHPLMYEAYDDFLRGFYDIGGDLAVHYTYVSRNDKSGSWGALQAQNQPIDNAPKYRALVEAVAGVGYVPEYTVAAEQATSDEFGAMPMSFRITRSGDKSAAQTVNFTLAGTASASDYVSPGGGGGGAITFAAGQTSALVTITPTNDALLEDAETVVLSLAPGAGYKLDGVATRVSATATITDDDGYLNLALPIVNPSFETGDLTGWTKLLPTPVTPTGAQNVIDIAPPSVDVPPPVNSPKVAFDGSKFAWSAGPAGTTPNGAQYQVIAQQLGLASHAAAIDTGIATINYTGFGAGWSADYAQLELRYLNAAGQQVGSLVTSNTAAVDKTWTKMTANSAVPAGARTVELRAAVRRAGGLTTDAGVDALAARLSYPVVPVVNIAATDANASEPGTNTATFTVTRLANAPIDVPLVVAYAATGTATSGTDYAPLPGTVTIAAGATSSTIVVTPLDDAVGELDETVILTLAGRKEYALGSSKSATATIVDNDRPQVTITATDDVASEAGGGSDAATFVVERLTQNLAQPLVVRYAWSGTATRSVDYQPLSGTLTIPAGESTAVLTLVPIDDTTVEKDETAIITLSTDAAYVVAAPSSATATIVNDDFPRVTVTATDASASETGPDAAAFTFTRSGEFVNEDLTVYFTPGGTATPGADYALPAEGVTIPAGQLSATVTITPIADGVTEGAETIVLTLMPGTGYTPATPSSATATIAPSGGPGNAPPTVAAVFLSGTQWSSTFKTRLATLGVGDATFGFKVPLTGSTTLALPWTNLNQISVRFSEAVNVDAADMTIGGVASATHAASGFTYDAATFTATWTLAAAIPAEKLLLDLNAALLTDLAGAALAGPTHVRVDVLPGDVSRNGGTVNSGDVTQTRNRQFTDTTNPGVAPNTYSVYHDPNGNGAINAQDVTLVRNRQFTALPTSDPITPDTAGAPGESLVLTDRARSVRLPGDSE